MAHYFMIHVWWVCCDTDSSDGPTILQFLFTDLRFMFYPTMAPYALARVGGAQFFSEEYAPLISPTLQNNTSTITVAQLAVLCI